MSKTMRPVRSPLKATTRSGLFRMVKASGTLKANRRSGCLNVRPSMIPCFGSSPYSMPSTARR